VGGGGAAPSYPSAGGGGGPPPPPPPPTPANPAETRRPAPSAPMMREDSNFNVRKPP
jgi:hypothetical protein